MRVWVEGRPRPGRLGPATKAALLEALPSSWTLLEGPLVLKVRFIFKRDPELPRAVPLIEPAIPGLVRAVLDEFPGIVYRTEQQLAGLHVGKEYGNVDGTELRW